MAKLCEFVTSLGGLFSFLLERQSVVFIRRCRNSSLKRLLGEGYCKKAGEHQGKAQVSPIFNPNFPGVNKVKCIHLKEMFFFCPNLEGSRRIICNTHLCSADPMSDCTGYSPPPLRTAKEMLYFPGIFRQLTVTGYITGMRNNSR